MTDAIAHRGPDGEGHWTEGCVGWDTAGWRSSILSACGHQPMISADHRCLVYNGEIYNFRELRAELEAAGYSFRSQSDTEVILNALAPGDPAALALQRHVRLLAVGQARRPAACWPRPLRHQADLYYAPGRKHPGVCIGAEGDPRPSGVPRNSTRKALLEYFTFQNIFTDKHACSRTSSMLPAGHYARSTSAARLLDCKPRSIGTTAFARADRQGDKMASRNWTACSARQSIASWSAMSNSAAI
jgi:asparagine synthase (glutamine-hydrolysing)